MHVVETVWFTRYFLTFIFKNVRFAHRALIRPFPSTSSSSSSNSSSSSSSSSTQRSNRGPVDEMHVFQKEVFSPRPEATFQVNPDAKDTFFNLKCKTRQMVVA